MASEGETTYMPPAPFTCTSCLRPCSLELVDGKLRSECCHVVVNRIYLQRRIDMRIEQIDRRFGLHHAEPPAIEIRADGIVTSGWPWRARFNTGLLAGTGPVFTTSWERGARYFRCWAAKESALYRVDPYDVGDDRKLPPTLYASLEKVIRHADPP